MTIRAVVTGVGHYLPERVVPNSHFETFLETTDEWIRSRSGIERLHFSADDQTTSDLEARAARAASERVARTTDDHDGVLVVTSTPVLTFPPVPSHISN